MAKKIITLSREFGSGGRLIGEKLAKKLDVPYYDKNILDKIAEEDGFSVELMEEDEKRAKHRLLYSLQNAFGTAGYGGAETMSINEQFYMAQFKRITEIAEEGNGGVIIGRCADNVLRDFDNVVKVFIYAHPEAKEKRVTEEYGIPAEEARKMIQDVDKARGNYYKYHTGKSWGDALNYDFCINSTDVAIDDITDLIISYVKLTEKA